VNNRRKSGFLHLLLFPPTDDNSNRKPADEYINDSSGNLMFRFLIRQLTGYRAIRMVYLPVNYNFDVYHEEKGL